MRRLPKLLLFSALIMLPLAGRGQLTLLSQTYQYTNDAPAPVYPIPSERQMAWHETEFYAFFHYGMNTFTNKEWGDGSESESTYAPTSLPNCAQWISAVKAAHMKGGIAVVKHHDGFCLWPTATTTHCVSSCSGSVAKTVNVPKLFSAACIAADMKYGFYISPWDRSNKYYGTDAYVTNVFTKQAEELLTYGNGQFEMWFDGANGGDGYYGGSSLTTKTIDKTTYYDKPNLKHIIHLSEPNCVVWSGGEARWVGNENGTCSETCWSIVTSDGSRSGDLSGDENGVEWNPAEADAKLTDKGWFWHNGETPKSAETLFQMYLETVGRNCNLILNCPPNKSGVLPDADVSVLESLGTLLDNRLGTDLALKATATASSVRGTKFAASMVNDGDKTTYWATPDEITTGAYVTLTWPDVITAHYVCLQEYIRLGQRVSGFTIQTSNDGNSWTKIDGTCTTIGYKRIIPLGNSTSSYDSNPKSFKYLRVTITGTKACPTLHTISVY